MNSPTNPRRLFKWCTRLVFLAAAIGEFPATGLAQTLMSAQFEGPSAVVASALGSPSADGFATQPNLAISSRSADAKQPDVWRSRKESYYHSHDSAVEKAIQFSETPFMEQFRMPIGSFLGGRVLLGGFGSVVPTENIHWGLPGSGSLPNWSEIRVGHPGLNVPYFNNSFGLSLTLHRTGHPDQGVGSGLGRCVSWLLGRV
jgi:hypothetical protein